MNPGAASVAEYLALLSPKRRAVIEDLRSAVARILTDWQESIEYGHLSYRRGEEIIGIAAQKHHYALYICGPAGFLEGFREKLGKLDCGKSCLRFKKPGDLPSALLEEILRARRDVAAA